jgi:DsbC/DsbD-like thiol-disulfide interchange protein
VSGALAPAQLFHQAVTIISIAHIHCVALKGMMLRTTCGPLALAAVTVICAPGLPTARAQGASGWGADMHSAARLIVGAPLKSGDAVVLRAGIQIKLDPGWDTYWRTPGDSGVPPQFDFTGSENIKSVKVLWPAPQRFPDGAGGHSIGYMGEFILPLRIVPNDPAKPSSLRLQLD